MIIMMYFRVAVIVNFNVVEEPSNRILETRESETARYLEVSVTGDTFGQLPFFVRYLRYEDFQGATARDLDRIFPNRPTPASRKFNTMSICSLKPYTSKAETVPLNAVE